MSRWHYDQVGQAHDNALQQAWQQGNVDNWDFESLNEDQLWQHGDPLVSASAAPPSPTLPPLRNTFNGYSAHAADTIFPPPRDFVARSNSLHEQLLHGQSNVTGTRTSNHARPSAQARARPEPQLPEIGRFGYIVDHLFDDPTPPADNPTPTASDFSADFVTLDESSSSESDRESMPPTTRRHAARSSSSLVNLTSASSSQDSSRTAGASGVKRAAETASGRAAKRRGVGKSEDIEEIDLANEAPSAEDELRQQQQREAIRAQQAAQEDSVPQRIGQRQCIICMENYTNATVTSCGHFFCHECLTQALMAGEKNSERNTGTCPVCRKPLSRKKKYEIIPIAFMTKAQFEKNQSKRKDILA